MCALRFSLNDSGVKGLEIRNFAPAPMALARISGVASVVMNPKVTLTPSLPTRPDRWAAFSILITTRAEINFLEPSFPVPAHHRTALRGIFERKQWKTLAITCRTP